MQPIESIINRRREKERAKKSATNKLYLIQVGQVFEREIYMFSHATVYAGKNREQSNNGNFHSCRFWCNELPRVRYGKKRGMFFATERNAINVEIQAFRNLTYNIARYTSMTRVLD